MESSHKHSHGRYFFLRNSQRSVIEELIVNNRCMFRTSSDAADYTDSMFEYARYSKHHLSGLI